MLGPILVVLAGILLLSRGGGGPMTAPAKLRSLDELSPEARQAYSRWIPGAREIASLYGYRVEITETGRTPERQAHLYAIGRAPGDSRPTVTNANAGESRHEYGQAWDYVLEHEATGELHWGGRRSGGAIADQAYAELASHTRRLGLVTGWDWTSPHDPYHVEVV